MEKNAVFAHLKDNNNNNTTAVLIISVCKRQGQATTVPASVESNHTEAEESHIPVWRVLLCALAHEAAVRS